MALLLQAITAQKPNQLTIYAMDGAMAPYLIITANILLSTNKNSDSSMKVLVKLSFIIYINFYYLLKYFLKNAVNNR